MPGVGFFGMLVIGALAGWIAERAMNRDHSLLTNILVGIAGSFVGGTLASVIGAQFYGFLGNLVVAINRCNHHPVVLRQEGSRHASASTDRRTHVSRAQRRSGEAPLGASMVTVLDTVSGGPKPRHPEKAHKPDSEVLRKPDWIRVARRRLAGL